MSPELIVTLVNYGTPMVVTLIVAIIGFIYNAVTKRQLESFHREALHMAIRTFVDSWVNRWLAGNPGKSPVDIINSQEFAGMERGLTQYLSSSVPEAMVKLKPSRSVVMDIAVSKIRE